MPETDHTTSATTPLGSVSFMNLLEKTDPRRERRIVYRGVAWPELVSSASTCKIKACRESF